MRVGLIRQITAWGMVAHESLARVLSDANRKLELCNTKRRLTGHSIKRRSNMGNGSAWGGRLPCKQDIQIGSIPIFSTTGEWVRKLEHLNNRKYLR